MTSSPSKTKFFLHALMNKWLRLGLWLIPKGILSRAMGRFAEIRSPRALVRLQIKVFSRLFDVNLFEAASPIDSFKCLQDFFTRRLKPGARKIARSQNALISPCDGFWGSSGFAEHGKALQIKGKYYSLENLIGKDAAQNANLANSVYATFYLSPKDYHRFHSPIDGHVVEMTYIPGQLWPVNNWAVSNIENLFCVNERVVMAIQPLANPKKLMYLVAVGATMVGKIRVEFGRDSFDKPQGFLHRKYGPNEYFFAQGQELGQFMFGSTLVLVAQSNEVLLQFEAMAKVLTLGECIGRTTYES